MKKSALILAAVLILTLSLTVGLSACNRVEEGFIHADGKVLIDGYGKPIGLMGTNLGGWLVQESYLVPTDVGGEYGQIDMMIELANQFGKEDAYRLISAYEDNWISEQDFANIKNMGFNCVRLPFTYLDIYDAIRENDGVFERVPYAELKLRDDAFDRLDEALAYCKKYGLYLILDLHGAVGSQNGNDHSGDIAFHNEGGVMWREDEMGEVCRAKTKELWIEVANRYKDERAVAFYDLLNEPGLKDQNGNQSTMNARVHEYFDELYKAIREVDENHAICMESCWESYDLPSPEKYGWKNVIYQFHHYNWPGNKQANRTFHNLKKATLGRLEVPVFIGEFNVWGDSSPERGKDSEQTDADAWKGVMELYVNEGWHFTTWNYKCCDVGSSWGLMNPKEAVAQANFRTDSFEDILAKWTATNSSAYTPNSALVNCITPYLSSFNAAREARDIDYAILKS